MTKKDKGEEMRGRSNSDEHSLPSLPFPTYLFTFHIPPLPPSLSLSLSLIHTNTHTHIPAHALTPVLRENLARILFLFLFMAVVINFSKKSHILI